MSAPHEETTGRPALGDPAWGLTASGGWSTLYQEIKAQTRCLRKEGVMAIKVLIKRRVSADKAREMITLFRQMRMLATAQEGYISGETLRSLEKPEEFIVISTWQSSQDWKNWLASRDRKEIQAKVDKLLGGETTYEVYHYGFTG
jgi:heme-degrading monooxygenase HmoA